MAEDQRGICAVCGRLAPAGNPTRTEHWSFFLGEGGGSLVCPECADQVRVRAIAKLTGRSLGTAYARMQRFARGLRPK
jgi:hypothetical protein